MYEKSIEKLLGEIDEVIEHDVDVVDGSLIVDLSVAVLNLANAKWASGPATNTTT